MGLNFLDGICHLPAANPSHPFLLVATHSEQQLRRLLAGIDKPQTPAERWLVKSGARLEEIEQKLTLKSRGLFSLGGSLWPAADPPVTKVWYRGEWPSGPYLVVVGPRQPSQYAAVHVQRFVSLLAPHCTVVSGLAYGIDALAIKTALEVGGRVIAVVPTGLTEIYPAANRRLAEQIIKCGGAVCSEFVYCETIAKLHFVFRNRLMAALADAVWLPEAAERSGTLATAKMALDYGTNLAVLPGDVNRYNARGSNFLIKNGAFCVTDPYDLAGLISIPPNNLLESVVPVTLQPIVRCLEQGFDTPDKIIQELKLSTSEVAKQLLLLKSSGWLEQQPDGSYQLIKSISKKWPKKQKTY